MLLLALGTCAGKFVLRSAQLLFATPACGQIAGCGATMLTTTAHACPRSFHLSCGAAPELGWDEGQLLWAIQNWLMNVTDCLQVSTAGRRCHIHS
jgi:hypothetical protein